MSTDADLIAHIESLDQQRAQSILQRNFAVLAPLLGDDLRYIHSSAVQENKAQYLDKLISGHYIYHGLDVQQREFRAMWSWSMATCALMSRSKTPARWC
jgi:hypothetical protein